MRRLVLLLIGVVVLAGSCSRGRSYQLSGQVLAIDTAQRLITIRHGDIPGFMPSMTMPFSVKDSRLLEGRVPGDLVTATLVVLDESSYLSAIERTGHDAIRGPLPAMLPPPLLEPGRPAADAAFVDQSGAARRLGDWQGRMLAITFVYSRCPLPDFCPRMNRNFAAVQHRLLATAAGRAKVHLLSVTFDPDHDTPEVLADYAKRVGANPEVWTFLTGERLEIEGFTRQFGLSVMRENGAADLAHNLRTAVLDGSGRLVTMLNGADWETADLLRALGNLK